MNNKFFAELTRVLAEQGIETVPPENGWLPVLLDGRPAFHVEPGGTLCIGPGDIRSTESSELYHKVAPLSAVVLEYVTHMEKAPLLQSGSGNGSYHLLADFNGVILAGKEKGRCGYQFATWRHDATGSGFRQGNYFSNRYQAAKQDFACRAGLISKERLFTDEQLTELYRCLQDMLEGCYELADEQIQLLEKLNEQIDAAVPDLHARILQAKQERMNEQTQQFNI